MECLSSSFSVMNSITFNNNNNIALCPRLVVSHAKNITASRMAGVRCAAAASKTYKITILPGDGIGPEIMSVAKDVLRLVGSQQDINFKFNEKLVGGAAIDATGVPLPDETLAACKQSDAVLLAAIGGYKWDNNERHLRPESGLLGLRAGLGVFANLRPAIVLPQFIGTIVIGIVNLGVAWWMLGSVKDICQTDLLVANSPWTCPGDHVFFDASVKWGLVGPKRIFGKLGVYPQLNCFFLRWCRCFSFSVVGTQGLSKCQVDSFYQHASYVGIYSHDSFCHCSQLHILDHRWDHLQLFYL